MSKIPYFVYSLMVSDEICQQKRLGIVRKETVTKNEKKRHVDEIFIPLCPLLDKTEEEIIELVTNDIKELFKTRQEQETLETVNG